MKTIALTQGQFAMVDDQVFDWLSQWKWCAVENKHRTTPSTWYARRTDPIGGSPVYMHRAIMLRMGVSQSFDFDHADADGLNNQFENIRVCSQTQNNGNRQKEGNCTSQYKGVSWSNRKNKWVARLRFNGKSVAVKHFDDENDAARFYDAAARVSFGEFARLNFP